MPRVIVLLAWFVLSPTFDNEDVRRFYYVSDDQPRVVPLLNKVGLTGGIRIDLIEVYQGKPDTLTAWVQHFDKGYRIYPGAFKADILFTCRPEYLPDSLRRKHVFPDHVGDVYVVEIIGSPRSLVVVAVPE